MTKHRMEVLLTWKKEKDYFQTQDYSILKEKCPTCGHSYYPEVTIIRSGIHTSHEILPKYQYRKVLEEKKVILSSNNPFSVRIDTRGEKNGESFTEKQIKRSEEYVRRL